MEQHETWIKGEDRKLVLNHYGRDVYSIDGDLLRELLRGAGWTEKKREAGQ